MKHLLTVTLRAARLIIVNILQTYQAEFKLVNVFSVV